MKRTFILSLIAVAFSLSTFGQKPKPVVQDNSFKTLEFTVNGVSFKMVAVEGGTFQMGATSEQQDPDSDEKPVHSVTLSNYYIGETEVTQALWEAVMGSNPSFFKGRDNPVERVNYNDCVAFVKKLNEKLKVSGQLPAGREFRLPTEAEWEFAARGGNRSKGYQYSGSNTLSSVAWYDESLDTGRTHPVKQKQANELGLYDMSGNVYEWCYDWYGDYPSLSQTNPKGPSTGSSRVLRGGSWVGVARNCRVACRDDNSPGNSSNYGGLRLAFSLSTFGQNPKPVVSLPTGKHNGHEYVDLGLPSGLKWATCNVGAISPSDYGDYYAWGETSTTSGYTNGSSTTYGKKIGDIAGNPTYDVARAKWRGSWRLPTQAEFQELLDNCTWEWTTQYGHKGYKVTSKKNGNSIFLPAAGWRCGTSSYRQGSYGYYWSATPYESGTIYAYYLYFDGDIRSSYSNDRGDGYSVRPVFQNN